MTTITYKDRRPETDHATRMRVRRARQNARTPGFTPVTNQKILARINAMQTLLTAGYKQRFEDGKIKKMPSDSAIRQEAENTVAKTLAQTPVGVRTRPFRGTGKDYRVQANG